MLEVVLLAVQVEVGLAKEGVALGVVLLEAVVRVGWETVGE